MTAVLPLLASNLTSALKVPPVGMVVEESTIKVPSPLIVPERVKDEPVQVKVRLEESDSVSLDEIFKAPDTVKSEVCKVMVPVELGLIVRLFRVCPAPVIVFEVPVIVTVELPALTVLPAKFKLPPTVTLVFKETVPPDKFKLLKVVSLPLRLGPVPLKFTVLVLWVKVPDLFQSPAILYVLLPLEVKVPLMAISKVFKVSVVPIVKASPLKMSIFSSEYTAPASTVNTLPLAPYIISSSSSLS